MHTANDSITAEVNSLSSELKPEVNVLTLESIPHLVGCAKKHAIEKLGRQLSEILGPEVLAILNPCYSIYEDDWNCYAQAEFRISGVECSINIFPSESHVALWVGEIFEIPWRADRDDESKDVGVNILETLKFRVEQDLEERATR